MNAFPNPHLTDQTGMTLLDYFAANAMQGLIAAQIYPRELTSLMVEHAYEIAEYMMGER